MIESIFEFFDVFTALFSWIGLVGFVFLSGISLIKNKGFILDLIKRD